MLRHDSSTVKLKTFKLLRFTLWQDKILAGNWKIFIKDDFIGEYFFNLVAFYNYVC